MLIIPELIVVYSYDKITWKDGELFNASIFGFLALVYAFTMCFLIKKLNKITQLQAEEKMFHSEKKKITRQFLIFTLAYIVRALEDVLIYFLVTKYNQDIILRLINWIFRAPCDILPISYVIYVHNRIYRRMS